MVVQGYFEGAMKCGCIACLLSIIAFVKKGKFTSHMTKHIAVGYLFIKEKIDEGQIEMEYTTILKPIQIELFRVMRK